MPLASGSRLGVYEIVGPLGAGGMGEVYRARDTRLDRTVAVKVLPADLSHDAELKARLTREARAISALSHPHVCALFDVGSQDGVDYLVMELLEGETLAERLARGPLPPAQVLRFGEEIGLALDAAHRKGIVHRDLKPGNVMLTSSGVKLLDFGLAKALAPDAPADASRGGDSEPTRKDLTRAGVVLGTLAYMAPEQLEGRATDARTDVFAYGAVLYEMATGRKAFSGGTPSSLVAAILASEPPPISSLQPLSPSGLDRVVATCLAKDPEERWRSAADVARQLRNLANETRTGAVPAVEPRRRPAPLLPWIVAGAAVVAAVAAVALRGRGSLPRRAETVRFELSPPAGGAFGWTAEAPVVALPPDGSRVVFVASDATGETRLYVRELSSLTARPIAGTEGARSVFCSPDGRSVAFAAWEKLKRVDLSGGAAVPICDGPKGGGIAGTWSREGEILFSITRTGKIFRVAASGGAPVLALEADRARGESRIGWPVFLPDGKRFLYVARMTDSSRYLMLKEPGQPARRLGPTSSWAQLMEPGVVVFARDGALLGQRLDATSGTLGGEPFALAEKVRLFQSTASASFAVSWNGTLAYQTADDVDRLTWFDRSGRDLGSIGPKGSYLDTLSIAKDGRRFSFTRAQPTNGTWDVWQWDIERGAETRLTFEDETELGGLWLGDGKGIVYSAVRSATPQLHRKDLSTGVEEPLLPPGPFQTAEAVSPDGRTLVFSQRSELGTFDLYTLSLAAKEPPRPLVLSPFTKGEAALSPDGRLLAFMTLESGRPEVYVTPFDSPGERLRVSTDGGRRPRFSRDGRELFFLAGNRLMAAAVTTSPAPRIGAPVPLFETTARTFDVTPDGKRFLALVREVDGNQQPITVVTNAAALVPN